MAVEGWRFISETPIWDADDREVIARATGLYSLTPSGWISASDAWFKAFALAYVHSRDLDVALKRCAGVDVPFSRMLTPEERDELRRSAREGLEKCREAFREWPL